MRDYKMTALKIDFPKPIDITAIPKLKNWNMIDSNIKEAWKYCQGSGIVIGVIDTGYSNHKDLSMAILRQISVVDKDGIDRNGHGTFVCGVIASRGINSGVVGVAPQSRIVSVKAVGDDGRTMYDNLAQAVYICAMEKCDIINMSIGGDVYDAGLHEAIKYAVNDAGITVVCAAGNDGHMFGSNLIDYPAKFSETIAVGASLEDKTLADFSTSGKELDFVSGGVNIYSTYLHNKYATMSGTSFSAPFVSGLIALTMCGHRLRELESGVVSDCVSPAQVKSYLVKYSNSTEEDLKIINAVALVKEETALFKRQSLMSRIINFFRSYFS